MISIATTVTFDQYVAADRFASLHGPLGWKAYFIALVYVLPVMGFIGLPLSAWMHIQAWPGTWHRLNTFDVPVEVFLFCLFLLFYPLIHRRILRGRYKRAKFDTPCIADISDQGIHIVVPGKAETRLEWAMYGSFAETSDLFLLMVQRARPVPMIIAKGTLEPTQQDELRAILSSHLKLLR